MATILTLPGFADPGNTISQFFNGVIAAGNTVQKLLIPQPSVDLSVPLPGPLPEALITGLSTAVEVLDDALNAATEPVTVMAHSLGSVVASLWLNQFGPTTSVDPADVAFILTANPLRKYGGVAYDALNSIPEDTAFFINDIATQFDGWADWPADLPDTSAAVAVLNAIAGQANSLASYVQATLTDPATFLEHVEDNITYTLMASYPFPLLLQNPIPGIGFFLDNPIIAQIDKVLRPLIEYWYNRIVFGSPPITYPPPQEIPVPGPPPGTPPGTPGTNTAPCLDPNHFYVQNGEITPQPWMQHRQVATGSYPDVSGSYSATAGALSFDPFQTLNGLFGPFLDGLGGLFVGVSAVPSSLIAGANKNDLLQVIETKWTNITPIDQWVYGLITRGGCRVTMQARSRGYLVVSSGYAEGVTPGPLQISSVFGCGADIGVGGVLAVGTGFCIVEQRQNALTIPLAPERCGWYRLQPGRTLTARVEVRFASEFWENSQIDGGNTQTETSYDCGETRLDLYAVPVLE